MELPTHASGEDSRKQQFRSNLATRTPEGLRPRLPNREELGDMYRMTRVSNVMGC